MGAIAQAYAANIRQGFPSYCLIYLLAAQNLCRNADAPPRVRQIISPAPANPNWRQAS
jgi:hypothetical protein